MEITAVSGNIADVQADAIVVNLFQGVEEPGGATGAIDAALDGYIKKLIADGEITGKKSEITWLHAMGRIPTERVVVVGLGNQDGFDQNTARSVSADVARFLRRKKVGVAATVVHGGGQGGLDITDVVQAMTEGTLLGLYEFNRRKSKADDDESGGKPEELRLIELDGTKLGEIAEGITVGAIISNGAILARDLINEPANYMTPTHMAQAAQEAANSSGLECTILEKAQMEELGMGSLMGVAKGSHEPPKFIILTYKGDPSSDKTIALIGKGITFDTGGISIKPAANMGAMKGDMGGGAAVIGALQAIGQLKPKINVTGLVAATENMPGGAATKPGDVLVAMSGKTIEVENTDAEGRLVLADALSYARKEGMSPLIDVATLTGAARTALGTVSAAIFGNDQDVVDKVIEAGKRAGEVYWQLPLFDEYKDQIKSPTADIKNTGGAPAGAITAAMFLQEFAEDTPWVHLDIAATSMTDRESGWKVKGATGFAVRTFVNYVLELATE